MLVELRTSRTGPEGTQNVGEQVDLPAPEAKRLIEKGAAIPVRGRKTRKAINVPQVEKAVR